MLSPIVTLLRNVLYNGGEQAFADVLLQVSGQDVPSISTKAPGSQPSPGCTLLQQLPSLLPTARPGVIAEWFSAWPHVGNHAMTMPSAHSPCGSIEASFERHMQL